MIKGLAKLVVAGSITALIASAALPVFADGTNSTNAAPMRPKRGTMFRGTITAVDATGKTITVEDKNKMSKTFPIGSETRIMKDGKPGVFTDAIIGQTVLGSYLTNSDGKISVTRLSI